MTGGHDMRRRITMVAALCAIGALAACSDGEKATTSDNSPREAGMTADSSPAYSAPGTGNAMSDTMRAAPGAGGDTLSTAGRQPGTAGATGTAPRDTTRRP